MQAPHFCLLGEAFRGARVGDMGILPGRVQEVLRDRRDQSWGGGEQQVWVGELHQGPMTYLPEARPPCPFLLLLGGGIQA